MSNLPIHPDAIEPFDYSDCAFVIPLGAEDDMTIDMNNFEELTAGESSGIPDETLSRDSSSTRDAPMPRGAACE